MTVLREEGVAGVRIDRLAVRLGLTKGSFHHHFAGVEDFRRSLLERYEFDALDRMGRTVASLDRIPPQHVLVDASAQISRDAPLEAAMRGWASQDQLAQASMQRIDTARLEALTAVWESMVADRALARSAAMIPHLILIGASVAAPRPTGDELTEVFELLGALIPAVPAAEAGSDKVAVGEQALASEDKE
ncbi:TetR/AcrR family transcriptional regulator [Leifsonia sp. SIMBA_070]|uniref:TetR/AcrR family transcriptional regulator n=1 Tax=Leifsonia sp. SIMBA_070 TaxID=3085810 RepID=UPI00397CB4FD